MKQVWPAREQAEDGSIALFLVIVALALLAVLGLVSDGGLALEGRAKASDLAQACARAGTRGIDVGALRDSGDLQISTPAAVAAVERYEANAGIPADERCEGVHAVMVGGQAGVYARVTIKQPTNLLRLVGVSSLTVTESAEAAVTQALPQ